MVDERLEGDLLEIERVICPTEEDFYKAVKDLETVKTIPLTEYLLTEEQRNMQEERLKQIKELL